MTIDSPSSMASGLFFTIRYTVGRGFLSGVCVFADVGRLIHSHTHSQSFHVSRKLENARPSPSAIVFARAFSTPLDVSLRVSRTIKIKETTRCIHLQLQQPYPLSRWTLP
jgi:hypothetical protein